MTEKILEMKELVKTYIMGDEEQVVLKGIDLEINRGDFPFGIGAIRFGEIHLDEYHWLPGCADQRNLLSVRRIDSGSAGGSAFPYPQPEIGFIFQQFQLLPRLSAQKNVELPLIYAGVSEKERQERSAHILERVGLAEKMKNRPNQLSGGQQQRVAIARALVTEPTILLADEPTGALDQQTGHQIMELFKELYQEGKTIVMITHDADVAKNGSRIVRIVDGNLSEGVYNA